MLALLRLLVFGFLILSVLYVTISIWSRATRARKLTRDWRREGGTGDKDAYISEGLADYDRSIRRKLILLVYIVPVVVIVVIVYVVNFM